MWVWGHATLKFDQTPRDKETGVGNALLRFSGTLLLLFCWTSFWGFTLQALETLRTAPDRAGGEAFFIIDDTPRLSIMESNRVFLESKGCKLLPIGVPYAVFYVLALLIEIIAFLLKPFYKLKCDINRKIVSYLYSRHWYTYTRATERLGYKPLYSFEEAVSRSKKHYDTL